VPAYPDPDTPSCVSLYGDSFTWAVARAFRHFHIRSEIQRLPWFAEFYQRDHGSGALPVTAEIVRGFESEARSRGQHPVVVVLPTGMDFDYRESTGGWVYQPLIEDLAGSGIQVFNVGDAMREAVDGRDHCELFSDCSGHYNAAGYALVAEIMSEHLAALTP